MSDSKLPVGASVSMNGCLSLRVSPVTSWLYPAVAQCQLAMSLAPRDPEMDKRFQIMDG